MMPQRGATSSVLYRIANPNVGTFTWVGIVHYTSALLKNPKPVTAATRLGELNRYHLDVGAIYYNKGIEDAQKVMERKMLDIADELYEIEQIVEI